MTKPRQQFGLALGFAGVLLFSGTLPATRLAVTGFDPLFLSAARATIAGLAGLVLLAARCYAAGRLLHDGTFTAHGC